MKVSHFLRLYEQGYRDFPGIDLSGQDLSGVMLISVDLTGAKIRGEEN